LAVIQTEICKNSAAKGFGWSSLFHFSEIRQPFWFRISENIKSCPQKVKEAIRKIVLDIYEKNRKSSMKHWRKRGLKNVATLRLLNKSRQNAKNSSFAPGSATDFSVDSGFVERAAESFGRRFAAQCKSFEGFEWPRWRIGSGSW